MTDGWDAADGKAGGVPHRIAIRPIDPLGSQDGRQSPRVEPIVSRNQREHWPAVGNEDERLDDLGHLAAHGPGGVLGRARPPREALNRDLQPGCSGGRGHPVIGSWHATHGTGSARLRGTGPRQGSASALRVRIGPQTLEPDLGHASVGSRIVKAVIVADGEHAPADRRQLTDADLIIAADGGADWLDAVGVAPHRLVGDLDSADPAVVERLGAAQVPVERHPSDKDASDLELSLAAAARAGADEIVVLGALGGVLDHLLANVLLLGSDAAGDREVRLVHGGTSARLLAGPARAELHGPPGSRVSLLAVGTAAVGVRTEGLRWPLVDERLQAGSSRGLGNVVEALPAGVSLAAGRLLVIEMADGEGDAAV